MLRAAGDRWEIGRPLGMWSALKREGHSERFLVSPTPAGLAQKIRRAEAGES
jgi:hypothetical protein